ncbi:MAG: hypothetical protein R2862_05450 [Thermoanaerobaculia bacterium]
MHSPTLRAAAIVAAVALAIPGDGRACSVCRCGDPTFNALGTDIFERGQFRFAVDFERLDKSQGSDEIPGHHEVHEDATHDLSALVSRHEGEDHGGREELREERVVATVAYAPTAWMEIVARLPWSRRELTEGDDSESAEGFGDPEFYAHFRVWSAEWEPDSAVAAGIAARRRQDRLGRERTGRGWRTARRTPAEWHRIDRSVRRRFARAPARPGFLALRLDAIPSSGAQRRRLSLRRRAAPQSGLRAQARSRFDAALELNYRDAAADETGSSGETDPNTGGSILFVTPRLLVHLGNSIVARLDCRSLPGTASTANRKRRQ